MGSNSVFGAVVVRRAAQILAVLLLVPAARAAAQVEITGSWASRNHEFLTGDGLPVDYTGLPLNDDGRAWALSYSQSTLSMVERQCQGWAPVYIAQGPFGLKISSDTEPVKGTVISYTIAAWEDRPAITIWMDGRPRPSANAEHTRAGFTIGHWEGNTLVAVTTHIQTNFLKKIGVPLSDRAVVTTRFHRHDDFLSVLAIVDDPVYLAEPAMVSKSFQLTAAPLASTGPPCISTFEASVERVPHYLPEKNPFVDEMTIKYGVPRDAVIGRPETLYPEYRRKMK